MMALKKYAHICAVALLLSASTVVFAQSPSVSPAELMRLTVENELKSNNGDGKFMFCDHKQTPHGTETKLLAETREATAGLVVARNEKILLGAERQAEIAREQRYIDNPGELQKKINREREDRMHTTQIVKALPDAFIFEQAGTELGKDGVGKTGDALVRLNFHPNPAYDPPSHTEQVLTGLQGYVLIDAQQKRIAKIDGTLFRDVDFGWGILGKLDKGGHFLVEQGAQGDGDWELTRMSLQFQGKILLFKKLTIESEEAFTGFRRVPSSLSFAEGLRMLENAFTESPQNNTAQACSVGPSRCCP